MAETTGIQWADATWNPWVGCEKVSPGCAHCYAEELVTGRMGRGGTWGPDGRRERTSASTWAKPLRWQRLAEQGRLPDGSENRVGHRPRIFCASLADVFEPRPELEPWRLELFMLIERTPSLDWLLLTKRPEEARDWLRGYYERWSDEKGHPPMSVLWFGREWTSRDCIGWGVLPNVWIGTSIENARFTWRADVLREIPAAVRFISAEPLLGSLLDAPPKDSRIHELDATGKREVVRSAVYIEVEKRVRLDLSGIDWLIVGGESGGRDARPMHPAWARELRDACLSAVDCRGGCVSVDVERMGPCCDDDAARPAFFFKQFGSWAPRSNIGWGDAVVVTPDGRTASNREVATTPEGGEWMRYCGPAPTAGGKLLDGAVWDEFPAPLAVTA